MAHLSRRGADLVLSLTDVEQLQSLHGDLRLPLAAISSVDVLEDCLHAVHGVRAPGTGFPGLLAVGTWRTRARKQFVVVHANQRRGLRITLLGAGYDELIVGCDEPERIAALLAPAP